MLRTRGVLSLRGRLLPKPIGHQPVLLSLLPSAALAPTPLPSLAAAPGAPTPLPPSHGGTDCSGLPAGPTGRMTQRTLPARACLPRAPATTLPARTRAAPPAAAATVTTAAAVAAAASASSSASTATTATATAAAASGVR